MPVLAFLVNAIEIGRLGDQCKNLTGHHFPPLDYYKKNAEDLARELMRF